MPIVFKVELCVNGPNRTAVEYGPTLDVARLLAPTGIFSDPVVVNPPAPYKLLAVLLHDGTQEGGHYTAMCKVAHTEGGGHAKLLYDDAGVTEVQTMLQQTTAAMVLVYERPQVGSDSQ